MFRGLAGAVVLALMTASAALADDDARSVRLIGSAPDAEDPAPRRFVLDLTLTKGDGAFEQKVDGWFAALPPAVGSGEATGSCAAGRCAIEVSLTDAKLSLSGEFAAGASAGRYALADDDGKVTAQGAASFQPLTGAVPGLGELAAPEAVTGGELKSLLEWTGLEVMSGNAVPDWPDDAERDSLAGWQNSQGEAMTGLIFAGDLAKLRANAAAEKARSGWTRIEGVGWSAAYPAALLPNASVSGAERRYASADGSAGLTIVIAGPLDDEAFSALTDQLTADAPGRTDKSYTRVNGDLTLNYVEAGRSVTIACHNRAGGLARLTFTHPAAEEAKWSLYDTVLVSAFDVGDDLKAP